MALTIKEHLNKIRKKAHATQRKNGHFVKMGEASAKAARKRGRFNNPTFYKKTK